MSEAVRSGSVVDWVEETCGRYPDGIAATGVGETLTFAELWSRSVRLSRELTVRGVRPEDRVGIWAEQSSDLLIGIVAIMAAGAAYVPLDPSYPRGRLDFIASDAGLSFVVAPDPLRAQASELGIEVISTALSSTGGQPGPPLVKVDEHNAAYVIYTSGSTGRPKGVVIEHHSVVDLLQWMIGFCDFRPGDRVMGTASPAADASVPNFLLPLVSGGTFVALPAATTRDPYLLADAIIRYRPRALQASPTMLRMLTETGWSGDKDLEIWTGGEPTPGAVIRYVAPRVRALCNYYGPTEATVQVTVARLGPSDVDSPIGTAREHVGCVVLDGGGRATAVGETGELFITGTALARGYLNNPDLTADRFAPMSLGGGPSERAYRTGDLAKLRADGSLVIVGRVDDQIKLRGYRIEPREIELRLMEHPQIVDAVVLALQPSETAEPRLVAFVKCNGEVPVRSARDFVRETLPDYMVPAVLVQIDQFPLMPNGKVDKRQLAELSAGDGARPLAGINPSPGDGPPSELERSVLDMFAAVLAVDVDGLGVDDDYFDLGGTSLGCVRLFMLIDERYGVRLPLSTLVSASTAQLLAGAISKNLLAGRPRPTVGEPPRHEWERVLCNLWSETLGVRDVRRSDNFFDLGGSAADAFRMIEQLRTIYGTQVTLAELYRAPTVSQLAVLTGGRSVRSNLVPLNTTGHGTPFFCIAGAGGLALNFLALARQLGSEQPFYGLQAQGIECRALPDFTLAQAAARHVKAIREVQPRGPYLIGGHSLGGVLALKVVQRLAADGEEVALLAVFDTVLTKRMIGPKGRAASVAGARAGRWHVFNDRPKLSTVLHLPLAGLVAQRGLAQFELFGLHDTIQARFARRLRPWAGRAVLYASDDGVSAKIDSDWGHLFAGQWSCVGVPGDHLSMMQRPNVDELATNLGDQIAHALASCEAARSDLGKSADAEDRGDAGNDVPSN